MSQKENRRKRFFANQLHREIFFIVFWGTLLPTLVSAGGLFYLIFTITADQLAFPEAIAYNLIPVLQKVTAIIIIVIPIAILIILYLAFRISHKIVGPFDRIIRELDERLRRIKSGPIILRKDDKFSPLVEKINQILEKIKG